MSNHPIRPGDTNRLAHLISKLVAGELEDVKTEDGKSPAAVALGRKGGLKGGKARAKKLTAAERSEIAKKAATLRWQKVQEQRVEQDESSGSMPPRRVLKTPKGT